MQFNTELAALHGTIPPEDYQYLAESFYVTSGYHGQPMHTLALALENLTLYKQHQATLAVDAAQPTAAEIKAKEQELAREEREATREAKRQQKQEQNVVINEARDAWKKAIADRKASIAQWDDYVKYTHDIFTALRREGV